MKKISLENVPRDVSFTRIYGLDQNWNTKSNRSWSCVGAPRDQHGFMYILCEEVYITTKEGRRLSFAKGDLLHILKGSEYNITFSTALGEFTNILINFNIRDTNGEEYALADDIVCFANDIPAKIVDDMFTVANLSTRLAYPTIPVTKTFYEILEKLNNHLLASKLHSSQNSVLPAIFYLDSHVPDNVSIPQLAQMCLLNESSFRKAFKVYTGMTPMQYKTYTKINKAKLLLRNAPKISVEEVAEKLGFYDSAYFHKIFVKETGKTPKEYRDKYIK